MCVGYIAMLMKEGNTPVHAVSTPLTHSLFPPDPDIGTGVPVSGMRYNSLLWMCTLNTLTWPDLTWPEGNDVISQDVIPVVDGINSATANMEWCSLMITDPAPHHDTPLPPNGPSGQGSHCDNGARCSSVVRAFAHGAWTWMVHGSSCLLVSPAESSDCWMVACKSL